MAMLRGFVWFVGIFALGACDGAFDLVPVPHLDGGPADVVAVDAMQDSGTQPVCLEDGFTGAALDPAKWNRYGTEAGVDSRVVTGLLEISVPAAITADQDPYGGIFTENRMRAGTASQVELVQVPAGPNNDFVVQLTLDSTNLYHLTVNGGVLGFGKVSGGSASGGTVTFNPTDHRFVRMRHDIALGEMVFEAGATGTSFTELGRTIANIPLASTYFEIYAGSFDQSPGFTVRADNVLLTGPCPAP